MRRLLKDLETQIESLKTASFKVCIPQGEEVINWLNKEVGEHRMTATFALQVVCSLCDMTDLPPEKLRIICHALLQKENDLPAENDIQELEDLLKYRIDELKRSGMSRSFQYRLTIFAI